jgi:hypothetical protein
VFRRFVIKKTEAILRKKKNISGRDLETTTMEEYYAEFDYKR